MGKAKKFDIVQCIHKEQKKNTFKNQITHLRKAPLVDDEDDELQNHGILMAKEH